MKPLQCVIIGLFDWKCLWKIYGNRVTTCEELMNSVFRVEILVLTYINITWQTCGPWLIIPSWSTGVSLHKTHQLEFETVYMYLQYFLLWKVSITEETQLHLFPSFSSHLSSCWILLPLVELPLCFYCCVSCLQWKLLASVTYCTACLPCSLHLSWDAHALLQLPGVFVHETS